MSKNLDILDILPLTALQEGLFALNKLYLSNDPYHIQLLFKIEGSIDEKLLVKSINSIVDKYPNLKSAFYDEDLESPIQIIAKNKYPSFNKIQLDIANLDIDQINIKIFEIAKQEFCKTFNLSAGCPIRILFINIENNLNYLILTSHHIIIDGWSLPLFFKEVMYFYANNGKVDLTASTTNYKDYIIWLKQKNIQTGLKAWGEYLSGFKLATFLVSKGSYTTSNARIIRYKGQLSTQATQDLIILCRQLKLTINSVFLFTWAIVLSYLTNCFDVVFGLTVSGRGNDLKDIDKMIGLFINTIACRAKLNPMLSLKEQCCQFQESLFKIREYEYIGLSNIQRYLKNNNNLFDTLLIFQNTPSTTDEVLKLSNLKIYPIQLIDSTHYPLTLVGTISADKFLLEAEVKSDLINIIDGKYIVSQVLSLLKNFSKYKDYSLATIPLLNKNLNDNNKNILPKLNNKSYQNGIWGVFKQLFERDSDAISLIIPDIINNRVKTFTRRELFYLSEKISALILSKLDVNISKVIRVGILLPRNEFIISSIFACIKLGLILVPLDIAFPDEKILHIARKSDLKLLITNTQKDITEFRILNLNEYDFDKIAIDHMYNVNNFISLAQGIYTIFTSGSTGDSKGVTATHGNIIGLINSHKKLGLNKLSTNVKLRVGHAWSFAFDASWQPLIYFLLGNVLILLDELIQKDSNLFIHSIHKYNIDFIETSPSLLKNIDLDLLFNQQYYQLKILGLGGEEIDNNLWNKLSSISSLEVINFYGPTETCVDAVVANLKDSKFPILGQAIFGFRSFVLDKWLRQCNIGSIGELYLVSDQITYGYLNDFKLTAVKFIASADGNRMYRTGDLVSLTQEGFLVYHGRVDDQIKINGFRVDPLELEKILIKNIQIANCKVIVIDTNNGKKLSAVVILRYVNSNKQEVVKSIYNYLQLSVASYLIPHSIIIVDEFPLTINGKLDIKSLPQPTTIISNNKTLTKTQVYLSNIIKNILSLSQDLFLDITIDFRSLGLDSILIIQFSNLLRQEGFSKINPRIILKNNNISTLASCLDFLSSNNVVDFNQENMENLNYFKLTPIMTWLVKFKAWQRFCQWSVIRIDENYNYQLLLNMIIKLVNIHPMLRLKIDKSKTFTASIQNTADVLKQDILKVFDKGIYEYNKIKLKQIITTIIDEINPEEGNILRVLWFPKANNCSGHIIMMIHHLAVDGISWRIILDDLNNSDKQINEITSFAKWSYILDNKKKNIEFGSYIHKWEQYLNIDSTALGTRYIDNSCDLAVNAYAKTIVINSEITALILKLSYQGFTLEQILLTIFTDVIQVWLNKKNKNVQYILIDKEHHGRDDATLNSFAQETDDLSRTVGWFTAISPLKLAINPKSNNIFDKLYLTQSSLLNVPSSALDFTLVQEKIGFSGSQIEFNFHGIVDSFGKDNLNWEMVIDHEILDILPEVSEPLLNREYSIEINSIILFNSKDKNLTIRLNMSRDVFSEQDFILMQEIWVDTIDQYYKELNKLIS